MCIFFYSIKLMFTANSSIAIRAFMFRMTNHYINSREAETDDLLPPSSHFNTSSTLV